MYLELKICNCGYPKNNHPFRHVFYPFTIYKNTIENLYTINSENFLSYEKTVCSIPECKYSKSIHNSPVIQHEFIPKIIKYRKINITVPEDAICCKKDCLTSLQQHKNILTHSFCINLKILNKDENDIVKVVHPEDEDIKVNVVFNS